MAPLGQTRAAAETDRLLAALGFHAPRDDEYRRVAADPSNDELKQQLAASAVKKSWIPATVLSANPLISYSGMTREAPLGLAAAALPALRDRDGWFLLSPTWSIEDAEAAARLRALAVLHRRDNPGHRLIFVCNTEGEVACMQQVGEAAFFYNKTANVSEAVFRPLAAVPRDLDAIYNAQLVPWKRHELSLGIPRCGFLFYRDDGAPDGAAREAVIRARHAEAAPGHVFINASDERGLPVRLLPTAVNHHLNRSLVGLCLSAREGAMFASMEYLMSGLAVVTTPSAGGRQVYFDDEYCLTVPPDPSSVAEAVVALARKGVPGDHIREQTLRRIGGHRRRFLAFLDAIVEASGRRARFRGRWNFDKPLMVGWVPRAEAVERAASGQVDAYRRGRFADWTAAVRRQIAGRMNGGGKAPKAPG